MAIWKRPDLPAGPLRDLKETLHGLRERSGLSSRQIADAMRQQHGTAPAHTTIHQLFTQPKLPPADLVLRVAEALVAAQPGSAAPQDNVLDNVDRLWQQAAAQQRPQSLGEPPVEQSVIEQAGRRQSWRLVLAAGVVVVSIGAVAVRVATADDPGDPVTSSPSPTVSSTLLPSRSQPSGTSAGPQSGAPADALTVLDELAYKCTDSPLGPGQYRYFEHRLEGGSQGYDHVFEMWIPPDQNAEWMLRTHQDPNDPGPPEEKRAPAAGFIELGSSDGPWGYPTPQFYAELPRDPRALYDQLLIDHIGQPDLGTVAFRLRWIALLPPPADLRAALLRGLRYHPGVRVSDFARTVQGQPAVSLSVPLPDGDSRLNLLVDPDDCHILSSQTQTAGGGIILDQSVELAIVDAMGQRPGPN